MIRTIHCKDVDGSPYAIHAIKHSFLSNYEILVPNRYQIIYGGVPADRIESWACDFNADIIVKEPSFNHEIVIVNLDPAWMDESYTTAPNDAISLEQYKYIVAHCKLVVIELSGDHRLEKLSYVYDDNDLNDTDHKLVAFESDCDDGYLIRETYKGEMV